MVYNYGEIRKLSESCFTWEIPDFISVCKKDNFDLSSPAFKFDDRLWYLTFYTNKEINFVAFCIIMTTETSIDCCQTYSLSIKDVKGDDYWSAPARKDVFSYVGCHSTYQGPYKSNVLENVGKITGEGILTLQVNFHEPTDQFAPETGASSIEDCIAERETDSFSTDGEIDYASHLRNTENSLKWCNNIKDLFGDECDLDLLVNGTLFQVHEFILREQSSVFAEIFKETRFITSMEINDVDSDAFYIFLLYLYTGKVENLTVGNVLQLHYISAKYKVQPLVGHCVNFIRSNLTVESLIDLMSQDMDNCEMVSPKTLVKSMSKIVAPKHWNAFKAAYPEKVTDILAKGMKQIKRPVNDPH